MADLRTTLALVLGVGLGVVLIAYPDAVVRVHTAGRLPHDRRGEYGDDSTLSVRWRRGVQALGGVLVVAAVVLWF